MESSIERIEKNARETLQRVNDITGLEAWRIRFLGRKSELSQFLRSLAAKPIEGRRRLGELGNRLRKDLEQLFEERSRALGMPTAAARPLDITQPGKKYSRGHLHPLTIVMRRISDIFSSMGFEIAEGPEVETEYNNFDALNIPAWHPARDLMDTMWLKPQNQKSKIKNQKERLLLRTHTSPVQIRYMETHQPPFRIIAPGRVYRHEATDARHEMQFHQVEGLMVGGDISLANLKAIVETFLKQFFGPSVKLRMRPGYFPFVEPGVEVDLLCIGCQIKGSRTSRGSPTSKHCKLCGGGGWLEFAGAGMVHPNVFRAVGYDPSRVQGFAFGMGVERLAMIKYKIDDIRLFHSGDLRFIKQF